MHCSFKPYEGDEKYIFVSYAHVDSDRVAPVLERLNKAGFRIWYDEGINLGEDYSNVIARHIRRCAVCMMFHSVSSAVSQYCIWEVNYAAKKKRGMLSVYLEAAELSDGIDMLVSSYQSISLFNYDSEDMFYDKLLITQILQPCRNKAEVIKPSVDTEDTSAVNGEVNTDGAFFDGSDDSNSNKLDILDGDSDRETVVTLVMERADNTAPEDSAAGACGRNLTWSFDTVSGSLIIKGKGDMWDYVATGEDGSHRPIARPWDGLFVKSVTVKDGVTSIGKSALDGCATVTALSLPESIVRIEDYALRGCSGLVTVELPHGTQSIESGAFWGCTSLKSVIIPDSVISIGEAAFCECTSLAQLILPDSVTSIGRFAFDGCISLEKLELSEGLMRIEDCVFRNCSSAVTLRLPENAVSIGSSAFFGCTSLKELEVPGGIAAIGDAAFYGCSSLSAVRLCEGVASIGDNAFRECVSLTSLTLPEGVTDIGDNAFCDCSSLERVMLHEGVLHIGRLAFYNCARLMKVEIGGGLVSVGEGALVGCSHLSAIGFYGSQSEWSDLGLAPSDINNAAVNFI